MKLVFLILAAMVHPILAIDLVQTNCLKPFGLGSGPSPASTNHQGWSFPGGSGSNGLSPVSTNLPVPGFEPGVLSLDEKLPPASTRSTIPDFEADQMPLDDKRSLAPSPPPLQPGVYRTSPYTCLVLVPGMHPDYVNVVKPGRSDVEKMPEYSSGLKFTPWSPAGK